MRNVEFEVVVAADGQIALPPEVASEIPAGEQIRILVMWDAGEAASAWRTAAMRRFQAAYAPEDAVYEQLTAGPTIR